MPQKRLFAFDFDGTITTRDTLIEFISYACGRRALIGGLIRHMPILIMMKLHMYPNYKAKQRVFSHFFRGMPLTTFNSLCTDFARSNSHLLRKEAIAAIDTALNSPDTHVAIVSASIDNWVSPFFAGRGITVIGTQIETDANGILTGRFTTPNCYGAEKVRRLLLIHPDRHSYHLTAFGDSRGDKELLAFADKAYYKPFRSSR